MSKDYRQIAERMAGVGWDDMPKGLRDHLDMTNRLCENADGALVSRQVIGAVMAPYLRPIASPFETTAEPAATEGGEG